MREYQKAYDNFSLAELAQEVLQGSLTNGMNAASECCDRWTSDDRVALHWISKTFQHESFTFADLREQSSRFAGLLNARGIGKGDVVSCLLPRVPELLTVAIGTWRAGAIYQPLFTAFGPDAITSRVTSEGGSLAKLIVTDEANLPKLKDITNCPPVLVIDRNNSNPGAYSAELSVQPPDFAPVTLHGDDPFVMLFTSGTTGSPKGVRWPLRALLNSALYMRDGINLVPEDNFWNLADPGWAYGMAYAVIGPLLLGKATTFFEGGFSVESTVRVIKSHKVTNIAAAPTAYRMMMAAGEGAVVPIVGQLRVASSAGEPLNPEVARWAARVLRAPLLDQYGQTEAMMIVNNYHGLRHARKEGTAGLPLPGLSVAVLDDELRPVQAGTVGVLAIHRPTSPLLIFDGYLGTGAQGFHGDWYLTGDTVQQDADGNFAFVGRNDDIITSSGYRIGPFDVESSIIEHPSVAEVAVVGKPDPERTEIVKAFIVLRSGFSPSDNLKAELQQHVRSRLARHAYPREIEFISTLPKTPSGKIQRYILRAK